MNRRWIVAWSFMAGVLVTLLLPVLLLAMGWISVGADMQPGLMERKLAPWARGRALALHAPKEKNPLAGNPGAIAKGLVDYRENCLVCHGAPDVDDSKISKGLYQPAPRLDMADVDTPDGELFWMVKHGLRMTPMPAFGSTHTDEEIWKIIAFIRHMPDLTAGETESLKAAK